MSAFRNLLPVLLLGAFAFACGTFAGAASWPEGPLGQALLLIAAAAGVAEAGDPLRLGAAGRWLPLALGLAVAASVAASPVPRAGRTALALLPAFLLLPAAAARAFETARGRRAALALWSATVAAVGLAGLGDALRSGAQRAAEPLGHHNLLGAFLVATLPVALLPLRARGPERALAALALVAGGGALLATRSFSALVAAVVVAAVATPRLGRARHLVAGLALVAAGLAIPRAEALLAGRDPSLAARRVYAEAALAGFARRPLEGWGPGATPWRLAEFVRPVPGVNPPGELVGETHSLPLGLLFELGLTGALLAAGLTALFALRRLRERRCARDPALVDAGLLGLLGGGVAGLGDAWLAVPALPLALALGAGAALGGSAPRPPRPVRRWPAFVALALLAAGALALARPALAWRAWDAATRAGDRDEAAAALARAARLDPGFPLYRARWAWTVQAPPADRARAALEAAASAGGVAPLWLRAGSIAWEAGQREEARAALVRALALDPLSGAAPFLLFVASEGTDIDCAARALTAEPRLGAATAWRARPGERERASWRLRRWPGIELGWKATLRDLLAAHPPAAWAEEEVVDLTVEVDVTPALASSLHLFRRTPLPADVARIRLDRGAVRELAIPSAAVLATSSAAAFPPGRCAPGDVGAPAAPPPPGDPLFRDGFESGDPRRWRTGEEPGAPH